MRCWRLPHHTLAVLCHSASGLSEVSAAVAAGRLAVEGREAELRNEINAALRKMRAYARDMEVRGANFAGLHTRPCKEWLYGRSCQGPRTWRGVVGPTAESAPGPTASCTVCHLKAFHSVSDRCMQQTHVRSVIFLPIHRNCWLWL